MADKPPQEALPESVAPLQPATFEGFDSLKDKLDTLIAKAENPVKAFDPEPFLARLETAADKLEGKTSEEAAVHISRSEKLAAVLPDVRAVLEEISDSADVVAHTRGPLARKALELLKEF